MICPADFFSMTWSKTSGGTGLQRIVWEVRSYVPESVHPDGPLRKYTRWISGSGGLMSSGVKTVVVGSAAGLHAPIEKSAVIHLDKGIRSLSFSLICSNEKARFAPVTDLNKSLWLKLESTDAGPYAARCHSQIAHHIRGLRPKPPVPNNQITVCPRDSKHLGIRGPLVTWRLPRPATPSG